VGRDVVDPEAPVGRDAAVKKIKKKKSKKRPARAVPARPIARLPLPKKGEKRHGDAKKYERAREKERLRRDIPG
jgi:hypothetical protein